MASPSGHAIHNLALDGKLRDLLEEWRRETWPRVSYKACAERINAMLAEKAATLDTETPPPVGEWGVRDWCLYAYAIEPAPPTRRRSTASA